MAIFKYEQNQLAICVILAHLPLKALFIFTVNIEASIHMCNYLQKEKKSIFFRLYVANILTRCGINTCGVRY